MDLPPTLKTLFFVMIMTFSADLMIAMLRKGNTGNEILQILDAITSTETEDVTEEVAAD